MLQGSLRRTRRAILAQGLGILAATVALAQAPTPAATAPAAPVGPTPKLVVAEPIHDAGDVSKGETVKADFVVENQGEAELEITGVHPACGCTVASFDAKVAPGGKGKIHAELDTSDFQGPVAKTITVTSNDPTNPRLTLTIKAKIEPHIAVFPGYARYIYVQTLDPGTVAQTLWPLDGQDFRVLSVDSPYPFIHASFREATEAERKPEGKGRQWRVEMAIQPDAAVGPLREFLVIKTDHPKQPEVRVPISGFVRPLLHVTPQVADFGAVEAGAGPREVALTLVNFGEDAITIEGIDAGAPGVEAKAEATEAGRRFKITVSLTPGVAKGPLDTTVRIRTSSKAQPVYVVQLKGTVS